MRRTRIKICGICSVADAMSACNAGADSIGLVFVDQSPRKVKADTAIEIVSKIPPFITIVGLFVNNSRDEILQVLSRVHLDLLQFHGDEDEAFCDSFDLPYIKVIRVKKDTDLSAFCFKYASAKGILLDSYKKGIAGGTGEAFDWDLIPEDLPLPVILAGGLNPGNVAEAVKKTRPWAVDVSSGVEASPGNKDREKIEQFIGAVEATR